MGERDAWPRANLEETGGRFAVGEKFYRIGGERQVFIISTEV